MTAKALAALACVCVVWCVHGAEQPPARGASGAEQSRDESGNASSDDAERTDADDVESTDESPEIFKPSEDISEDIAVPFPVDI